MNMGLNLAQRETCGRQELFRLKNQRQRLREASENKALKFAIGRHVIFELPQSTPKPPLEIPIRVKNLRDIISL